MRNYRIAVIGLGYVGLPLAIEFAKKYPVLGFDIDKNRISELSHGEDRTREADLDDLRSVTSAEGGQGLQFSSCTEDLLKYNIYIVTVPTPINQF